jgi:SAM-dependent methyltransferase
VPNDTRAAYDRVAETYAQRIFDELTHKPFDRAWLERLAGELRGRGTVCDLGCGPGHVARYLAERGVDVLGVDLSPGMVEEARRRSPHLRFETGDLRRLDVPDGAWAGIAAFYSLIHVAPDDIPAALAELHRVLAPGGALAVAVHIGRETVHLDEWWGHPVSVDFHFFEPARLAAWLGEAGFEIVESIERDPYPGVEHPSRRAYLWARAR